MFECWVIIISILAFSIIVHPEPAVFHGFEYIFVAVAITMPEDFTKKPKTSDAFLVLLLAIVFFAVHCLIYYYFVNRKYKKK